MGITAIRGFNDILPGESEIWRHLEEEAFRTFRSYGFSEIRVPIVEKTELFLRSIGETTDIVEKEMYTFQDRHGDSVTLRPEGTAPVVRAYIEHKLYTSPVAKLCYAGPMFRYERPQKGRYRQFYQIGAEVLGDSDPGTDAETVEMLMGLFGSLGLESQSLQVNSLGCQNCRPGYKEALKGYLKGVGEKLCENCLRRMDANPLRALDCKSHGCIEATQGAPRITDYLCDECMGHFAKFNERLAEMGVSSSVNPRMVRGLDYYTKTTFEIISGGLGTQNAIAAGGRYDRLVNELGGPDAPCFGFAFGVERVALLLKERWDIKTPVNVFITLGADARKKGIELVRGLRKNGIRVIADFSDGPLKNRMKRADRIGARHTVILGEDELKSGVVAVKDMKTASQEKVAWEALRERMSAG